MSPSDHEHEFVRDGAPHLYVCACGANLWAIQTVLDAAADDARRVAGDAHYTGCRVRQESETVEVWLSNAPAGVLRELEPIRPGVYVIHNDAPRSLSAIEEARKLIDFHELTREGIDIVSHGPTVDGYLSVGVMCDVPTAQAKLDETFGHNLIRVHERKPAIAC
jgi:hypothetical protein